MLVVSERRRDANAQCILGHCVPLAKDNRAIAFKGEILGKHHAKGFNQSRLTVEVHCVTGGFGLLPAKANGAAASGSGSWQVFREVRRFAPLQGLFDFADPFRGRDLKNQFAQCE